MDVDLYVKIMEEDIMASIDYYGQSPEDVIFQQDKAYLQKGQNLVPK